MAIRNSDLILFRWIDVTISFTILPVMTLLLGISIISSISTYSTIIGVIFRNVISIPVAKRKFLIVRMVINANIRIDWDLFDIVVNRV